MWQFSALYSSHRAQFAIEGKYRVTFHNEHFLFQGHILYGLGFILLVKHKQKNLREGHDFQHYHIALIRCTLHKGKVDEQTICVLYRGGATSESETQGHMWQPGSDATTTA